MTKLIGRKVPEKTIQREILAWLKSTELLYWRQNSGCVFVGKRMILLGEHGLPDIICIIPPSGRMCGLEVKSATGAMRPSQQEFMTRIRKTGGFYFIVRSLKQAQEAIATCLGEEQLCSAALKLDMERLM